MKNQKNSMKRRTKTRITFFDLFKGGQKVISGFPPSHKPKGGEFYHEVVR